MGFCQFITQSLLGSGRSRSPLRLKRGPYLECAWLPQSNCSPNSYESKRQVKRRANQTPASPKMRELLISWRARHSLGRMVCAHKQSEVPERERSTALCQAGGKRRSISFRKEKNPNPKYAFRSRNLKLFSFSFFSTQPPAFLKGSFPASE